MIYIALGIIGLLTIVALFTFIGKKKNDEPEQIIAPPADCCGAHAVCEKLMKRKDPHIEYFEDQELDVYKNADPDNYTDEQIEEFREVLYTLKEEEIEDWLISLDKREVPLPSVLRPEAIDMIP